MPSKKKKYNSRFPPARIKKIMQTDEDIGKVAAAVPVLISKCLEMFLASLLTKAGDVTKSKRAKTMSRIHLKECIMTEPIFDFLKDHVAHIPDIQGDEEAQGSTNIPMEFDNQTKVVRKRSLPKPKRTPKKRAKLGHENESDESDALEDSNENGSGNEGSEGPVTSSSLVSPAVLRKLESQRSLPLGAIEGGIPEKKSSIHIPLDVLMSGEEVPTSVSIEKDMVIAEDSEDTTKSQGPQTSVLDNKSKVSPNIDTQNSLVRKGVIVPNTSAHPVPSRSLSHPVSRRLAVNTDSSPSTSAQGESSGSMDKKDRKELEQPAPPSSKPLQEGIPGIDHHPGSMLSLLYSSSVPSGMSLSPLPGTSTVQQTSAVPSQEKYAYSPLTQLQYSESKQPLLYPSAPPATNGNQFPPYQFPPYVPRPTQRHYLGYPQTILTPPGQPMSSTNAQMAMHSAMAQVKPKSRIRSDDDDYDV